MDNWVIDPTLLALSNPTSSLPTVDAPTTVNTISGDITESFLSAESALGAGPITSPTKTLNRQIGLSSASLNGPQPEGNIAVTSQTSQHLKPSFGTSSATATPTPAVPAAGVAAPLVSAAPAPTPISVSAPRLIPAHPTPGPQNSSLALRAHLNAAGVIDRRNRHNFTEGTSAEELARIRNADAVRRCRARQAEARAAGKTLPATKHQGRPRTGKGSGKKSSVNSGVTGGRVLKKGGKGKPNARVKRGKEKDGAVEDSDKDGDGGESGGISGSGGCAGGPDAGGAGAGAGAGAGGSVSGECAIMGL